MSILLPFHDKRLSPVPATSMYHHDSLLHIDRQTKHIQRNLQSLLDAQSEGLSSGLAQPLPDETLNGSFTPTSSTADRSQTPSVIPTRQPSTKKVGLKSARRGIFQSIYALLKLREEEREILESQADERGSALREIQGFTTRRNGLEDAISTIHTNQTKLRAKQLEEEAHDLETDIVELETRLFEMKARHRHLVSEIASIENSVDAKLSSYNESLTLLQSDVREYLRNPPVQPLSPKMGGSTFHSLNPKRRTLEVAQEHWQQEQEDLKNQQLAVDAEIVALEEGGGVWKEVITDITGFEKRLGAFMRRYVQLDTQEQTGAQVTQAKAQLAASVAEDLEQSTQQLECQLQHAEANDWRLLVCCIAAELEALRVARGMLLPAFGISPESDIGTDRSPSPGKDASEDLRDFRAESLENDDPEPPADLLKDGDAHHTDSASRSEDEDLDPAWLLPGS